MTTERTESIQLTMLECNALLSILVQHALIEDSTQVWEDVITGEETTLFDLICLFTRNKLQQQLLVNMPEGIRQ